jgi:hypothetical protein
MESTIPQNQHICSDRNLHGIVETHFHNQFSVNIWCGIIGKNLNGQIVLEDSVNDAS